MFKILNIFRSLGFIWNLVLGAWNLFTKGIREKSRLRRKFLWYFFLAGIVPLILMGLVGVYGVNRTHRIDVSTIELNLAKEKALAVEKFIGDTSGLFQLQVGFEQFSQITLPDQNFLLDKLLESNTAFLEVSFLCLTPEECKIGKETAKKSRLQKITPGDLVNQSQNPKFLVAKDGRDYISPVYFTLDGPMVTLASPVKNAKSEIISVLTGETSLKEIQENVSTVQLGSRGYLYIVDFKGNIVAHSQNLGIGEPATSVSLVADVLAGEKRTGLEKEDIYQSLWQERVIGAGVTLPKLSWAAIVEWPFRDAQRVVGTMISQIGGFSLATLLLVVVLATFVAWQLVNPISKLKEGAKTIGEGKFDYRISLRTGDEIEELGHSLNKMAEDLKDLEELHEIKLRVKYLAESLAKEQELSKLKDQFITVASHQLYTPLSIINWTIESLHDPKMTPEKIQEGLRNINQSREDILNIANDLLTVSEIGFKYKKNKSEILSLGDLIKASLEKFKNKIVAKKLKVDFEKEVVDDKGDFAKFALEKVFDNLIDNAVTYSNDSGNIEIKLTGDDQSLTFSIRDEGIGIPEGEKSSIFREFFRAKNAIAKKNVGTGLGLFIVKSIIEGHAGKVWFESKENEGSTFSFTVPRSTPKEAG